LKPNSEKVGMKLSVEGKQEESKREIKRKSRETKRMNNLSTKNAENQLTKYTTPESVWCTRIDEPHFILLKIFGETFDNFDMKNDSSSDLSSNQQLQLP
jgi:hypothetical protein